MNKMPLLRFLFFLFVLIMSPAELIAEGMLSPTQCQGSAMPYPAPAALPSYPDTLSPVMINHVGRHGARFQSSAKHTGRVLKALREAQQAGTIMPLGLHLIDVVNHIIDVTDSRWGALDSLGADEQRGIAQRMVIAYPGLFGKGREVVAISSYVPRCVTSMYVFLQQISDMCQKTKIDTSYGPQFSPLLRFFDTDAYKNTVGSEKFEQTISDFYKKNIPIGPLRRVLGTDFPLGGDSTDLALELYSVLSSMAANGLHSAATEFLTTEEYNQLWRSNNFRQYLTRTATTLSSEPAAISAPLLRNLIETTDSFICGDTEVDVRLRFGHAETLMPLLSLMGIPGCDYMTTDFQSVSANWQNFRVVPMAANLQLILFKSNTGRYYVRIDHNERPVSLPGYGLYIPWEQFKDAMLSRLADVS